jgi:hypothetical protein
VLPSEKLAIAAHLHVLLRRKVGCVTDIEWMATNADYATEIIRIARYIQPAIPTESPGGSGDRWGWADPVHTRHPITACDTPYAYVVLEGHAVGRVSVRNRLLLFFKNTGTGSLASKNALT